MIEQCRERLGDQVTTEFMQCQIEVGTVVCGTVQDARADLARLRRTVSVAVREHGFEIIAASTHPFAKFREVRRTPKGALRHPRRPAPGGRPPPSSSAACTCTSGWTATRCATTSWGR